MTYEILHRHHPEEAAVCHAFLHWQRRQVCVKEVTAEGITYEGRPVILLLTPSGPVIIAVGFNDLYNYWDREGQFFV